MLLSNPGASRGRTGQDNNYIDRGYGYIEGGTAIEEIEDSAMSIIVG